MNIDDWGYVKEASPKEVLYSQDNNTSDKQEILSSEASLNIPEDIALEYTKPDIEVETTYMFLVSGGEKREQDYMKYLQSKSIRRLQLVFISNKRQGLTPTQMKKEVDEAIDEESFIDISGRYTSLAKDDIIYLITV